MILIFKNGNNSGPWKSSIFADLHRFAPIFADFRQADLRRSFIVESDNSSQFDGKKFYIPETENIFDIFKFRKRK